MWHFFTLSRLSVHIQFSADASRSEGIYFAYDCAGLIFTHKEKMHEKPDSEAAPDGVLT